ncbi:MAG TPA: GspE/PulE family protein [Bacilli bacterium]|nr:GspE/PulE family protein [Bacilli bacterium]
MLREFDYENLPIVEIVNEIVVDAIKKGASDIHFDPYENKLKVRIRIDGELEDYAIVPNELKKSITQRIKIIANMNITESRLPQDGAIKSNLENVDLDLRVSSLPLKDGEKIVIRILDYSMSTQGLETLGFSEKNLEKVHKMIAVPNGIVLVTGATGTGKTTTVYSILQKLNTKNRNLVSVEDPIEMSIEGINQLQVMPDIGLTFGSALRSILRQDPDIIMIGEIRDDETAKIAVRASITGHLVLSTLHTNNSLNTIERLLDMEVERYLLGSALTGIVSQRLARRVCPKCRQKRATTPYEKSIFKKVLKEDINEIYTVNKDGCPDCMHGYKGRIAIQEVLMINQHVRDAIVNNVRKEELRALVYGKSDVTTILEDGLRKVVDGVTTFDEILRVIDLESDFVDEDTMSLKSALLGKETLPEEPQEKVEEILNIKPDNPVKENTSVEVLDI